MNIFFSLANPISHWHKLWGCRVGEFICISGACLTETALLVHLWGYPPRAPLLMMCAWLEQDGRRGALVTACCTYWDASEPHSFRGQGLSLLKAWLLGFGDRELGLPLGSLCSPGQVTQPLSASCQVRLRMPALYSCCVGQTRLRPHEGLSTQTEPTVRPVGQNSAGDILPGFRS